MHRCVHVCMHECMCVCIHACTHTQNTTKLKWHYVYDFNALILEWKRQLVLRHKLTMHTAFSRGDNTEPASVTALAVARYVMSCVE